jgi:hypothetical protein
MTISAMEDFKVRGLRPTVGNFLVVIFTTEIVLLASERFRWFPLNDHKGWTVLADLTVAAVGVLLIPLWLLAAFLLARRVQFTLRSLLALTVVVSIPCSWLAAEMRSSRRQREAVSELAPGDWVKYDYAAYAPVLTVPPGPESLHVPKLLRSVLGDDFFSDVVILGVYNDRDINRLEAFPRLRDLIIGPCCSDAALDEVVRTGSQIEELTVTCASWKNGTTNAGLRRLRELPQLRRLTIYRYGQEPLIELPDDFPQLRELYLTGVSLRLEQLTRLPQLESLWMSGCKPTDADLAALASIPHLASLTIQSCGLTDDQLKYIGELDRLETLDVGENKITNRGLSFLRGLKRLRRLGITGNEGVTNAGLEPLKALKQLRLLSTSGSGVTDDVQDEFRKAVPELVFGSW